MAGSENNILCFSKCIIPQPGLPVGFLQYLKDIGQGCARGRFPRHPGTGSPKDLGTKILVPTFSREKVKPITTPPDKVFERPGW